MNGQVGLPVHHRLAIGISHRYLEFTRNYRKRAFSISLIQLMLYSSYVIMWWLTRKTTLEEEIEYRKYIFENVSLWNPIENGSETVGDTIWTFLYVTWGEAWFDCDDPAVCFIVFKQWFTSDIYAVRSTLHICCSALLICATQKQIRRPLNIMFCTLAKWGNLILTVLQITISVALYPAWLLPIVFPWDNIFSNREANGLMKAIQILAPPSPGHSV